MSFFTAITVEEVKRLIELGHDVNSTNCEGKSVLHYASEKGNLDIVKLLCEAGADVNKYHFGCYPIDIAAQNDYLEIVKYFVKNTQFVEHNDVLYCTSVTGNTDVLDFLLTLNLELDSQYHNPLYWACACNKIDSVDRLLNAGANPNIVCGFGDISIVEAVNSNNLEIIKKLVMFGADYHRYGGKSLAISCYRSYDDISEFLIGLGCDVNCCMYGMTTLMYACEKNNLKIVKLLLERGANPDFVNEYRKKAIDYCTSDEIRTLFIKN